MMPVDAARRTSAAGPALAGAVLLVAVLLVAACSSAKTSPSPSGSPSGSAGLSPFQTPTPSPIRSTDGTDPESALKALLPGGGTAATCTPAEDVVDRGAQARIKCVYKALGQTVWMSQYQDADQVSAAFAPLQKGSKSAGKGCEVGTFHGVYAIDGIRYGELACLKKGTNAWVVWTVDGTAVLGEAVRKADKVKALSDWWKKSLPVGTKGTLKLTTTTPPPAGSPAPSASSG
jgi:hypothetical protein